MISTAEEHRKGYPERSSVLRRQGRGGTVLSGALLTGLMLLATLPFLFMVVTSLQETTTMTGFLTWEDTTLDNYVSLFADHAFAQAILTSVVVVTIACVLNATVCSLAAFAFEKKPFPGSEALFWIYIATMMVPPQVIIIPLYNIMREMGLLGTHLALALPIVNAFGVFLIRQFMKGIPDALLDAARIDGASDVRIFLRIVLPNIKPVIIALTVFTFLTAWNDFLWPLVSVTDEEMQTVTLAAANLQGQYTVDYGLIMAGATMTFIFPLLLYVVLQRQFVEGVAVSGMKG